MSEQVYYISDLLKLQELRFKNRPVIAQFYTEWCPPCKPTKSILQKEVRQNPGKFSLASINCDEADEINIEYEIEGVPTVIAFNCDEKFTVFDKILGYDQKKLRAFLDHVKTELYSTKN